MSRVLEFNRVIQGESLSYQECDFYTCRHCGEEHEAYEMAEYQCPKKKKTITREDVDRVTKFLIEKYGGKK